MDKIVVGPSSQCTKETLMLLLDYCVEKLGGQVVLTAGELLYIQNNYELRIAANTTQHQTTLTLLQRVDRY